MAFVKSRLGMMMFLQYAVWGIWLPILGRYLQAPIEQGGLAFTPGQVGWILGLAGSIGAVSAPFLAGQFTDRNFSTERFLAFLLIAGGIVKWITAYQTTFQAWLWLSILYSVLYSPTLALTNSLAFAHLKNPETEFPMVRVWGTIGWIAASWLFPLAWLISDFEFTWLPPFYEPNEMANVTERLVDALIFSGVISIGYAVFCLFLPHTPPKKNAAEPLAFKKAFGLMRYRSFALLVAASLPISMIHQIYFIQTSPFLSELGIADSYIGPVMTIGQFAEIGVMFILGFMLKGLGFRLTIALGGLAYVLRYAIWGTDWLPVPVIVASQMLHGFCYACFFAGGFIYVDRIASDDIRNSVQTVFGIIILGLGPILGSALQDRVLAPMFSEGAGITNYSGYWYTLSGIALVTTVLFLALFRDETASMRAATSESAATELAETPK